MEQGIEQADIIGSLCAATSEVFTVMLGVEVANGDACEEREPPPCADTLMSLIGLAGDWTGTGGIRCSATTACRMASALLMCECESVDSAVLDAVAEITNMIIGNFKLLIEPKTGQLGLSIPSVVYGRNYTLRNGTSRAWTVVPFTFGGESFQVRICMARTAAGRGPAHLEAALA